MGYPAWFILIKKWCELEGKAGLTVPFIYGALQTVKIQINLDSVLAEMMQYKDSDYALGLSDCSTIQAPVLSILSKNEIISLWKYLPLPPNNPDPFFYYDQELKWSASPETIIDNLKTDALKSIVLNKFSRQFDQIERKYIYSDFTKDESEFILNTLSQFYTV